MPEQLQHAKDSLATATPILLLLGAAWLLFKKGR